jgi:hypothetical protein
MVAVQNLKREMIQLILSRKRGGGIISRFKFWTATIFLHAHLQVVYYKCVKFHKNPISGLGGVALTRYMDEQTDGRTDRVMNETA